MIGLQQTMRAAVGALLLLLLVAGHAFAQAPAAAPPAAGDMDALVRILENDAARARLIEQLRQTAAPPAPAAPAPDLAPGRPDSVAGLIAVISAALSDAGDRLSNAGASLLDVRGLSAWFLDQARVENRRELWMLMAGYLALALAPALIVLWRARKLVAPFIRTLETKANGSAVWRTVLSLGHFLLQALPVLAFAATGYVIVALAKPPSTVQLLTLALLSAMLVAMTLVAFAQALLAPLHPRLRPLPVSDESAAYVYVWARRIVDLLVFPYFVPQAALLVGVPPGVYSFLTRLIALIFAMLLVVLILQNRTVVQRWLVSLGGEQLRLPPLRVLRERLASIWHILAIAYILAALGVWMLGVRDGFTIIARNTLATLAVFGVGWIVIRVLNRIILRAFGVSDEIRQRYPFAATRADRYLPIARRAVVAVVQAGIVLLVLQVWGLDILDWLAGDLGRNVLSRVVHIGMILAMAVLALELANGVVHLYLDSQDAADDDQVPSQRVRTLLPLIRNVLIILISTLAGLVILSELGVSIGPLLAGAGVAGVAIGFGAQTLVKDFITGVFILIEDSLHVGDVARLGGKTGVVEAMTIRTVRLRDTDGTVYTIPFSSVTMIENLTKDFSYAVMDVRVAYTQDYERVVQVLRDIGQELKSDPRLGRALIGPIEILGLEEISDAALIIRVRIKAHPQRRWDVRREFNRRVKERFEREGIEFPFPPRPAAAAKPALPPPDPAPEPGTP